MAGQLLAYVGYMLAYRDVARASGGPCFRWATTARIVIFGTGAAVLGASVGGLAVDFWALRRTGTKTHVAVRRVLAVGTIEWTVLSHPVRYRAGAIGYPIYWAADMLTLYAAVRAFAVPVSVISLVLAYATSYVISALPLPVGGAGGIEAAMALALHAVGISLASALLAVFVYRIVTFWLPVIPALILLPGLRRLNRRLPAVPHTRPDPDEVISFRPAGETGGQTRQRTRPQAPAAPQRAADG